MNNTGLNVLALAYIGDSIYEVYIRDYLISKNVNEEPYKNVYLIQMYMGLRVGEVLALKSSDIDLNKNLMRINKTTTLDKDGKSIIGNTTKTYSGNREIPIPKFMRPYIIEQMEVAKNNKDHLLFLNNLLSFLHIFFFCCKFSIYYHINHLFKYMHVLFYYDSKIILYI